MQEVAAVAKGTDSEGPEGAAWEVPPAAQGRALLGGVVDKQAAAAIVTVAGGVVAAAQFSLVLGVTEGDMELMEAMGKLAALCVLAETCCRVGGAQLRLVAGGAGDK